MAFRYGGQRSPDTVNAGAVPLDKLKAYGSGEGGTTVRVGGPGVSLKAHGSGVERTIPVELSPGEYVVDVDVTVQQGDPSYFFRVMVE
jgi:hypothetical protein